MCPVPGVLKASNVALPITSSVVASLWDRGGFRRVGYLDYQISDWLLHAGIAGDGVQCVGRLIEYLARLQRLHRTVVDFHLVGAFQDISDCARMPMRRAALSAMAFGETHGGLAPV